MRFVKGMNRDARGVSCRSLLARHEQRLAVVHVQQGLGTAQSQSHGRENMVARVQTLLHASVEAGSRRWRKVRRAAWGRGVPALALQRGEQSQIGGGRLKEFRLCLGTSATHRGEQRTPEAQQRSLRDERRRATRLVGIL